MPVRYSKAHTLAQRAICRRPCLPYASKLRLAQWLRPWLLLVSAYLAFLSQTAVAQTQTQTQSKAAFSVAQPQAQTCVILLHGMGRTAQSMRKMERTLNKAGYLTHNSGYQSRKQAIQQVAQSTIEHAIDDCTRQGAQRFHFVTHSLGGILLRIYLQGHNIPDLERIVMLAPPNQGSQVADELKGSLLYQKLFGDVGQQLGTEPNDLIRKLQPIPGEIGIIAGTKSLDPWFSPILPGKDDGKVSVDGTRLLEMQDFIAIPASHWHIMRKKQAIQETLHFLEKGVFSTHPSVAAPPD